MRSRCAQVVSHMCSLPPVDQVQGNCLSSTTSALAVAAIIINEEPAPRAGSPLYAHSHALTLCLAGQDPL